MGSTPNVSYWSGLYRLSSSIVDITVRNRIPRKYFVILVAVLIRPGKCSSCILRMGQGQDRHKMVSSKLRWFMVILRQNHLARKFVLTVRRVQHSHSIAMLIQGPADQHHTRLMKMSTAGQKWALMRPERLIKSSIN